MKAFKELIELSVKASGSTEYDTEYFEINIEGQPHAVCKAFVSYRDILLVLADGTATFLVDSYGDRNVAELFDWEIGGEA